MTEKAAKGIQVVFKFIGGAERVYRFYKSGKDENSSQQKADYFKQDNEVLCKGVSVREVPVLYLYGFSLIIFKKLGTFILQIQFL